MGKKKKIQDANLQEETFRNYIIENCNLQECTLEDCEINECNLQECTLIKCNVKKSNLQECKSDRDTTFDHCNIQEIKPLT